MMTRATMRAARRGALGWVAALAVLLGAATQAQAHNVAADLSVWGSFGTDVARCQRAIARAAAYCSGRVLALRNACLGAQVSGEPCDQAATDAAVAGARMRATDLVAHTCTTPELQTLRYIDLQDAQNDVIKVCRGLDTAATTASYGPAMFGGTVAEVNGSKQACVSATGRAATKLLRVAMRARQGALDEIAATNISLDAKQALLARSAQLIAHAVDLSKARIAKICSAADFQDAYGRTVDDFLGRIAARADCLGDGVYVQNAVVCPPAVCGDGMQVAPEECDDGNTYDGDGCRSDCMKSECDVFPTTYDLIQKAIFENHGCTADACHGSHFADSGGLDLRAGASYASLVDQPAQSVENWKRMDPGNHDKSLLWRNLAARTLSDPHLAPLRGMPVVGAPISQDELDALRIWIVTGGAARDANLPTAASLLHACVPEPEPVKIEPLAPPAPGTGVQLHMPAWTLAPESEAEVCFSSYYDLTDKVPAAFKTDDGEHFRYKDVEIRQDPLSHHLIVDLFRGTEAPNDPIWGVYKCRAGDKDGQVCDPLDIGFCGSGDCATDPDPTAIACIGFGPQTGFSTLTMGGFAFAQTTSALFRFPDQVYDELPLKGVVLWNSHAFNLTRKSGSLEAWVNITFPAPDQQQFQQQQIFDVSKIFWTDRFPPFPLPQLMPFQDMEVCQVHEFSTKADDGFVSVSELEPGQTAHLFEISGHMHGHGERFQIFRGDFVCAGGAHVNQPCSPFQPEMCPDSTCADVGGRDPNQALLYTNFIYNDPVIVRFDDDPLLIHGDAAYADRTFTFCGHYDNGKEPNIQKVKRLSTSPPAGAIHFAGLEFPIGGPCPVNETRCIGGPHHNELCNGNAAACESSPGAGDGDCDACPLTGGFRTQDEMFILFGNYWVTND